jgi:hypothetical protein
MAGGRVDARVNCETRPVYDAVYTDSGLWDMAAAQRQTLTAARDDPYPGLLPTQSMAYEKGLIPL